MKLKPLQSNAVKRLLWAEGVIATETEASFKLHDIKLEDPIGYEFLIQEVRDYGNFTPETKLLLAILLDDDIYEPLERVCQAIVILSETEVSGAELN